jgi:hypothetical protein
VAVAIDVPDEERLGRKLAHVDDGRRIDRSEPSLKLADLVGTVIHEDVREGGEDSVLRGIDDEDRLHGLPPLRFRAVSRPRAAP